MMQRWTFLLSTFIVLCSIHASYMIFGLQKKLAFQTGFLGVRFSKRIHLATCMMLSRDLVHQVQHRANCTTWFKVISRFSRLTIVPLTRNERFFFNLILRFDVNFVKNVVLTLQHLCLMLFLLSARWISGCQMLRMTRREYIKQKWIRFYVEHLILLPSSGRPYLYNSSSLHNAPWEKVSSLPAETPFFLETTTL